MKFLNFNCTDCISNQCSSSIGVLPSLLSPNSQSHHLSSLSQLASRKQSCFQILLRWPSPTLDEAWVFGIVLAAIDLDSWDSSNRRWITAGTIGFLLDLENVVKHLTDLALVLKLRFHRLPLSWMIGFDLCLLFAAYFRQRFLCFLCSLANSYCFHFLHIHQTCWTPSWSSFFLSHGFEN